MNSFKILFASLIVFGLFSCSDDEIDDSNLQTNDGITTFGIRHDKSLSEYENAGSNGNGFQGANVPNFDAVVFFTYSLDGSNNKEFVATGVLVDSNWVLTAGHNFFLADEQDAPADVSGIEVYVGNDPNNPSQTVRVSELRFHPTWESNNEVIIYGNDLCLVKLDRKLSQPSPHKINYELSEPLNSVVWYAGYGDYSNGGNDFSKKHAIQNALDRIQSDIRSSVNNQTYFGGLLAFDFDSPEENINTLGDTYISEDEPLLGNGGSDAKPLDLEGASVEGDSGSPLFVKISGEWKVAGILSGGAAEPFAGHKDGSYGDISVFTRTATAQQWIKSVIQ